MPGQIPGSVDVLDASNNDASNNPDTYACGVKGPASVHGSKSGVVLPIGFP